MKQAFKQSILDALEDPSILWKCVMPRDISDDRYRVFIEQGLAAIRALKVGMPAEVQSNLEPLLIPLGRELRASIDFFLDRAHQRRSK